MVDVKCFPIHVGDTLRVKVKGGLPMRVKVLWIDGSEDNDTVTVQCSHADYNNERGVRELYVRALRDAVIGRVG